VWLLLGGLLLGGLLALTPIGWMVLSVIVGAGQIRTMESRMRSPQVYKPVAETLALYCQSDQDLFPKYLSYAWFPAELAQIGHGRGQISTNFASIEMGGGFHHFGYHLLLDEGLSGPASNVWQLSMYSEGSNDRHLTTLALAVTQHLGADALQKLATVGFDKSLARGFSDESAYKGKVLMLLRFGKTSEAAATCGDWIKREPDHWLPRFTYAHLRCRLGQDEAAAVEFKEWIQAHTNFAHCVYLCLFNLREGKTNEALRSVGAVLRQPFVEPSNTDGNKFYLGQNVAAIAYQTGDYDLCLAVCDKMLADVSSDKWWKRKIWRLRAATMAMKGNQETAPEAMKRAESFRDRSMTFSLAEMTASDARLRNAIESRNLSLLRDCQNWADDGDSWFSPFETDETGIHGSATVPTPYPKSWRRDQWVSVEPEPAK
jgi:hypothetical protein